MANLVAPVTSLQPYEERIIEFKGLNRRNFVEEGEMSDMKNLTSDNYPLLTPRKLRGTYELPAGVVQPLSIMTKFDRLAMIAKKKNGKVAFFYDGNEITKVIGLTADTQMVAINTKICFFPQKTYLTLVREGTEVSIGEFGHLDFSQALSNKIVTISNENATLAAASGGDYSYDDAIDIGGTLTYTPAPEEEGGAVPPAQTKNLVASCIIEAVSGNVLTLPRETFIELTGEGATDISFTGTIKRDVPDIKHVIEWNNRLWGVSDEDNTIYACKLGDPKNWKYYQGTALDSYYAQQGTDEQWTGCAAYSSHLIFFKENRMTKIYGTSPSTFQVTNTRCFGVEKGSSKSVVVLNNVVLYKSTIGIMAYEGGDPYCISEKLNCKFRNVVAGTEGTKYYASVQREDGENEVLVMDIDRASWHKEDDVRFRDCTILDSKLLFISDVDTDAFDKDKIYIVNPDTASETVAQREWMAVFGAFDEMVENQKIFSKMSLRLIAQPKTTVTIYIKMDDGEWERVKQIKYTETGGVTVPIVPRRCDRFYIKIVGRGDCEIKSLTRRFRRGSGVKS